MRVGLYLCGGEQDKLQSAYPLGLGYILSNVSSFYSMKIYKNWQDMADCDVIGLSSAAFGLKEAVAILGWFKTNKPKTRVVIGGQGTLWDGLEDYPFDHIVKGDGEVAMMKILQGEGSRIMAHYDTDLNALMFPERGGCGSVVPMISSRGCPYSCKFCSSKQHWGRVRWQSPEYFITEVRYLLIHYPRMSTLYMLDDLFTANRPRLRRIRDLWVSEGWSRRLSIMGFVRADIFDEELVGILKDLNMTKIRFGAESGSDRVLQLLGKRATVADNQRTVDLAKKHGFQLSASFMFGIPGETPADVAATHAFIKKNEPYLRDGGRYFFQPFPGTEFYRGDSPIEVNMRVR